MFNLGNQAYNLLWTGLIIKKRKPLILSGTEWERVGSKLELSLHGKS